MKHLIDHFPFEVHSRPRNIQADALSFVEKHDQSTLEMPPGHGKTEVAVTFLREGKANGEHGLFYIMPNKAQVQQTSTRYPEFMVAFGRHEYDCLYYGEDHPFKADEIPCLLLDDCPHRVNQDTGETEEEGADKCPYYQAKFEAKHTNRPVVATIQFHLFTHIFAKEFEPAQRLVIDEADDIAEIFRNALSYEISDYHLYRAVDLLKGIGAEEEAKQLEKFTKRMIALAMRRRPRTKTLLDNDELVELINHLVEINERKLKSKVSESIREGKVDKLEQREILKKLETLIYDLRRYILSLGYSVSTEKKNALSYTYAYYEEEKPEDKKVQYKLVISSYYVAPLIQKILAPKTLAMSGSVGNPEYFGYETGIKAPFIALKSEFPAKNRLVCLPSDIRDLAFDRRSRQDMNWTLRQIIRIAKLFSEHEHRSLVIVQSNDERQKFMTFAKEAGLNVTTYTPSVPAREALQRFKDGEGDVLIGTRVHYGRGADLPKGLAEATFFLRPGFASPYDPISQFEERRFSDGHVWGLRKWRAMKEAWQVANRNIRGNRDKGVCFFMSKQFKPLVYHSIPAELKDAYDRVRDKTLDECVQAALELLAG